MGAIYEKLTDYCRSDYYGFHMPGHKRNQDRFPGALPYGIDITEIEGFDDLHHADGILKEAQERAARVYHAGESHFLINGSTVGILSAILGTTQKGDTVLVARNCHKSVYHAVYMNELKPVYLFPGVAADSLLNAEISAEDVKKALEEHREIRAVILVSPTYDGVVLDIGAIAGVVHEKGIPLIVDEAHGAHFGFHPYFPANSNSLGADIVIHSLHKTLPSLTQTALLHMNGEIVHREPVRRYLHMLQSSSPSYVLMASIDSCVELLERERDALFLPYVSLLAGTREELSRLKALRLEETRRYDPSKIVLSAGSLPVTGKDLYDIFLKKYRLQMEMMAASYVLAMTSPGDTEEGMERLVRAAFEIDREAAGHPAQKGSSDGRIPAVLPRLPVIYSPAGAEQIKKESVFVPQEESAGYISLEYAYLYPPGIPLIVPGERITGEVAALLRTYREKGYSIKGPGMEGQIEVLAHG